MILTISNNNLSYSIFFKYFFLLQVNLSKENGQVYYDKSVINVESIVEAIEDAGFDAKEFKS